MERGNNRKSERLLQTPKEKKSTKEKRTEEKRREEKNRRAAVPLKGSAVEVCAFE